ncbi:CBS domain-containing protein [Haloarchaeobius iranensis]|uniref:CBS domain-containing protein n=1 Tax=Haloarchaeobius iranensis TaxID=996166 RepID=A0A1G9TY00_9EURY|nr:CBS domain-containing protein [Haloarchaeobius iranensis]SDM52481.1 CBS domain-containing protein [Haloarchaeobius iranensis]
MERDVSIRDVTAREFVGVSESDSVHSTVQLMHEEDVGSVLVLRGSTPVGIMTERDVLEMVATGTDPESTSVGELMSQPVITMAASRPLADAAETMSREEIRNLVVTDGTDAEDIVGVLTERDVIEAASTLQASRSLDTEATIEGVATAATAVESEATLPEDEYGSQGVCELCGALTDSLHDSNGQLVCSDCRQV